MILMINGSMRGSTGNTGSFLRTLEPKLKGEVKTVELRKYTADLAPVVEMISRADVVILGSPLYVDGFPSNVIRLLEELHDHHKEEIKGKPLYGVSNLGFWEGQQIYLQHQILEHFCRRSGMQYCGAIGIGAGPFMRVLTDKNITSGPAKCYAEGMNKLADAINSGSVTENIYTKAHGLTKKGDDPASPNRFYRFLYIRVAHRYWMKEVNKFGLKRRDVVKYHGKYVFDD